MIDFIIVGRGLAANVLMHAFHQNQVTFKTIGDESLSNCSTVAAGIWNPIVFKRLTKSWLADELIECLNEFYPECEKTLGEKIVTQRPIIKPFTEDQERVLWIKKSKTDLVNFLDPEIKDRPSSDLVHLNIQNGYAKVRNCGNLNIPDFLNASSLFFKKYILRETFDHKELQIEEKKVIYKGTEAKGIIFCEGHLVKNNPFFKWIPLKPAKGEVFTIKTAGLKLLNSVFNKNGFLMDLANSTYKVGATYAWDELNELPTKAGAEELHLKLKQMISCDYTVLKHEAGIRPSSVDRRPIIGTHPVHPNLFIFNGLGTKGVMLAPYFAKNFVNFYLQKDLIKTEVNVNRFYHLYDSVKNA